MNQVSVLVLPDWKFLCQVSEMQFCIQLYNDICKKKLFYIYKLIHIHLNPRILIASFLLAIFFCFFRLVFLTKKEKFLFYIDVLLHRVIA